MLKFAQKNVETNKVFFEWSPNAKLTEFPRFRGDNCIVVETDKQYFLHVTLLPQFFHLLHSVCTFMYSPVENMTPARTTRRTMFILV